MVHCPLCLASSVCFGRPLTVLPREACVRDRPGKLVLGTAGVSTAQTLHLSFQHLPLISFGVSHLSDVKCTGKEQPVWDKTAVVSEGPLGCGTWLYPGDLL